MRVSTGDFVIFDTATTWKLARILNSKTYEGYIDKGRFSSTNDTIKIPASDIRLNLGPTPIPFEYLNVWVEPLFTRYEMINAKLWISAFKRVSSADQARLDNCLTWLLRILKSYKLDVEIEVRHNPSSATTLAPFSKNNVMVLRQADFNNANYIRDTITTEAAVCVWDTQLSDIARRRWIKYYLDSCKYSEITQEHLERCVDRILQHRTIYDTAENQRFHNQLILLFKQHSLIHDDVYAEKQKLIDVAHRYLHTQQVSRLPSVKRIDYATNQLKTIKFNTPRALFASCLSEFWKKERPLSAKQEKLLKQSLPT